MRVVVQALVARGHEVWWYAASKFAHIVEAAGATHVPMSAAIDWDDADVEAALPALRGKRGLARVRAQLRAMFIEPMVAQLRDLEALADRVRPEAVIADQAHLGAALLAETRGLPWVGVGISALVVPSVDVAPFGSALPPLAGDAGKKRNGLLNWLIHRVLFASVNTAYRRQREAAGLPAGQGTYFDVLAPQLFLQPTIPAFEYPRSDLPAQVHFVGPLVPPAMREHPLPPWWGEVLAAHAAGTPIVLVTQGTLATDARELAMPALRALADAELLVVVTLDPSLLAAAGQGELPANARVAAYVPYQQLLPLASVMVTNGGYGGVQMALGAGVPLVVAGGSEEKPEIAARVAWSGAGIDLRTGRPRVRALRLAVMRVLAEPAYRERARALAGEMARHDAPATSADLIEAVIVSAHAAHAAHESASTHASTGLGRDGDAGDGL